MHKKSSRKKDYEKYAYKDTFDFKIFPKYEYTKFQKKRIRFFQGRIEHFKKIINYADNFNEPNNINLVYLIGYNQYVKPYVVEKTKSNLVVLCANVPQEVAQIHDSYWEKVKKKKDGFQKEFIGDDGMPTEEYYKYVEYFPDYQYKPCVDDYLREMARCEQYYQSYIICDKLHEEKPIKHNLDAIIKRYFPRGREQRGCNEFALRPSCIEKAINAGLNKKNDYLIVGYKKGTDVYEKLKPDIKHFTSMLNNEIRKCGYADIVDLIQQMKEPPYGWGEDCHAGYCIGYALSDFVASEDYYFCFGDHFPFVAEGYARSISQSLKNYLGPYDFDSTDLFCVFKDTSWRLVNRLAFIFDIPERLPLPKMVEDCRRKIASRTTIPVAILDENLGRIMRSENFNEIDSNDVKKMLAYFDWDTCKSIKYKFNHIEKQTIMMIIKKFPNKNFDIDEIIGFCTSEYSGWCWDADMFWELVDRVINDNFKYEFQRKYFLSWRELYAKNQKNVKNSVTVAQSGEGVS